MANKNEDFTNELNLDKKVTVSNIAGWSVGFARIADGIGDVTVTPNGSVRLSRNEIIAQVKNGNKLFTGIDGKGSHATLIIEDKETRIEVEFDSENGLEQQKAFSDSRAAEIFNIKSQSAFEKAFKDFIKTRAEKYAVIQTIKRLKVNDYSKIKFVEDYTGFNMEGF